MAKTQKKRDKKVSNGSARGAKRSKQSELSLVLMGKGIYAKMKRI